MDDECISRNEIHNGIRWLRKEEKQYKYESYDDESHEEQ